MERDLSQLFASNSFSNFNSHAHVERDDRIHTVILTNQDFNSHAHVERDEIVLDGDGEPFNFNSHAHVERDTFTNVL